VASTRIRARRSFISTISGSPKNKTRRRSRSTTVPPSAHVGSLSPEAAHRYRSTSNTSTDRPQRIDVLTALLVHEGFTDNWDFDVD
jgi:hypothetical protein